MSVFECMSKLNPKTMTFRPGTGIKPDIDWEDVCGAIAQLSPLGQSLAYCLYNPRAGREKLQIVSLCAAIVRQDVGEAGKKCKKQGLDALCHAIASSAVYQVLYPQVCKTRKERMAAGGIVMDERSYFRRWEQFEVSLIDELNQIIAEMEWKFIQYLNDTKKALLVY